MKYNLLQGNAGRSILGYGATDTGKTSAILTLKPPIKIYSTEDKGPRETWKACYPDVFDRLLREGKIAAERFDTTEEYIEDVNKLIDQFAEGNRPFESVVLDGLTAESTNVKLSLEDQQFEKQADANKKGKFPMIEKTRMEIQNWGDYASWMKRLTKILVRLSAIGGITFYATALVDEYPSWARSYEVAPLLMGKEYPSTVAGYFDYIGYIRKKKDGSFPSTIQFVDNGGTVFSRCTSAKLREKCLQNGGLAPLDFSKILKVIDG